MSTRFEVLDSRHDRAKFTSGVGALDHWFRTRASQDQRRHVAQVFEAIDDEQVVGFYSLSMFTLALEGLPVEPAKRLPRYDASPAGLVGRLARAEHTKATGLGGLLLADAIKRVLAATESIAAYAIVVDAKDASGQRFYEAHGFIPLPSRPTRLFLLTATAAAAVKAASSR